MPIKMAAPPRAAQFEQPMPAESRLPSDQQADTVQAALKANHAYRCSEGSFFVRLTAMSPEEGGEDSLILQPERVFVEPVR